MFSFDNRDVTDSFFRNPKSDGYLKTDRVGFEIANC